MAEQWRPVADGVVIYDEYGNNINWTLNSLIVTEVIAGRVFQAVWRNPANLRLCERVEAAAITPDDEANSDRYYRGFNDGVEFAQKRVEVDDEISPEALQAAGWEYRGETHEEYERWLSDDASIPYVEVGHDMSVAIYYEEESSACIRVPGCTTMSQLAALVKLLTGAD